MNTRSWLAPTALGLCLLAAAAVLATFDSPPAGAAEDATPAIDARRVRTAEVTDHNQPRALTFPGVLRAADRVTLSFPVGARLVSRSVRLGDRVAAGQVVARLETDGLRHELDAARGDLEQVEARLEQARRDHRRTSELLDARAATRHEHEQTAAAVEALQASADSAGARVLDARRKLGDARLAAPFAGTVTRIFAEPGEVLSAGLPVIELSGDGALEVEVQIPESLAASLTEGAAVGVELPFAGDGSAASVSGQLERIGRATHAAGGLFPARVALESRDGLLPGMAAEVTFELPARREVTVPLGAVLNPGADRPHVFKVVDGRVVRTEVEVTALAGDRVALRGGLATGDRVVTTGHTSLVEGDRVEVVR